VLKHSQEEKFRCQRKTGSMTERCLQSLAILLAGLFSAERAGERAHGEAPSHSGAPPEPEPLAIRAAKLDN
jgi:hypothetical protein